MWKRIIISVAAVLTFCTCTARVVTVEAYGAKGDGVSDDSPAFNRCMSLGRPVSLKSGKTYLLRSRIDGIESEGFELRGNGATIVIAEDYPLRQYDNIFCFADAARRSSFLRISDLNVSYLPAQKFPDRLNGLGDSYFVFIENCREVNLERITLDTPSKYNNLTFFASLGVGNLTIRDCNVRLNTLSRQGGAVWVMNKRFDTTEVTIDNCLFEHDTFDECICFSALELEGPEESIIKADVRNCTFVSACEAPSSGFIIAYNHYPATAHIDLHFKDCSFNATGHHPRRIISYQSGEESSVRYGIMHSTFVNCSFEHKSQTEGDTGVLALANISDMPVDDYTLEFRRCKFKIRNIHPLIGDKDGSRKGRYIFRNCTIDTDCEPFKKYYNVPTSEIFVSVDGRERKIAE